MAPQGCTAIITLPSIPLAPCTAASLCHAAPATATQARLADACVDDGLAEAWGAALQTNCTLERLNLESNAVGTRGVRALAAALRVNRSLRELKLCNGSHA